MYGCNKSFFLHCDTAFGTMAYSMDVNHNLYHKHNRVTPATIDSKLFVILIIGDSSTFVNLVSMLLISV